MKQQIRKSVFETNSSSVHSIVISKKHRHREIPETLQFTLDDYGWEVNEYSTPFEKASYLYTALYCCGMEEKQISFIRDTLAAAGCIAVFQTPPTSTNEYYIDHSEGLYSFLDVVFESPENLLSYLFDDESAVYTYNDNMECKNLPFADKIMKKVKSDNGEHMEYTNSDDFYNIRKGN